MSEAETIEMIGGILIPLQDIHNRNIIHRDLKPSNIRIRTINEDEDELILIDFGIAKEILEDNEIGLVTEMGVGTEGYRPKEQKEGKPVPASDIYPIGVMGLQAITGLGVSELTGLKMRELQVIKDGRILPNAKIKASPKFIEFLKYTLTEDLSLRYPNAPAALKALNNLDKIVPFDIADQARENTVTEGNIPLKQINKRSKPVPLKVAGVIALLGVISSLITINSASTRWWEKVVEVSSETSPYENKKYNIKLEYPKNWIKKELKIPDTITREVVSFTQPSSSNNSVIPTISIVIRPVNNEQDTLEKIIKLETDGIDKSSIIKTGRSTINGREAYNFIYTVDENLFTTEYLKAFFKTNKNIYIVTYSSNKADFDNSTKVVDDMIKSIQVKS